MYKHSTDASVSQLFQDITKCWFVHCSNKFPFLFAAFTELMPSYTLVNIYSVGWIIIIKSTWGIIHAVQLH